MGSPEQAPNGNRDLRLYPLLHPDLDKYQPDAVQARLDKKRRRMQAAVAAHSRHAEESRKRAAEEKRLNEDNGRSAAANSTLNEEKPGHEANLDGHGWITYKVERPVQVKHTEKNDSFFRYDQKSNMYKARYKSSIDMVRMLQNITPLNEMEAEDGRLNQEPQPLAFLDIHGNCYTDTLLLAFEKDDERSEGDYEKHNAVLAVPDNGDYVEILVKVDDLYYGEEMPARLSRQSS